MHKARNEYGPIFPLEYDPASDDRIDTVWFIMKSGKIFKALACLVAITSVLSSMFFYKLKNDFLLSISLMAMLGSLLYLFARTYGVSMDFREHRRIGYQRAWLFDLIFAIVFLSTLYSLFAEAHTLPMYYFVLSALLSTSIAVEIFFVSLNAKRLLVLLMKIMALSFILRFSLIAKFFPNMTGFLTSDLTFHIPFIEGIHRYGHAGWSPWGTSFYIDYPILHILAALTGDITGLDTWSSLIVSVGFFNAFSVIFIYLLANKVFNNNKIGLTSSLVVCVSNWHIAWSTCYIPNSLGYSFASMVLYLATTSLLERSWKHRLLAIVALLPLIITHPVPSFLAFMALSSFFTGYLVLTRLLRARDVGGVPRFPLVFGVMMVSYWIHPVLYPYPLFDSIVYRMWNALSATSSLSETTLISTQLFGYDFFYEQLGQGLMFGLAVYASFVIASNWLRGLKPTAYLTMSVLTMLLIFPFIFLAPVQDVPGRGVVLVQILIAPLIAVAIYSITSLTKARRRAVILSILVFLITFTTITTREANFLTPMVQASPRMAFRQSEIPALTFLESHYNLEKIVSMTPFFTYAYAIRYPTTIGTNFVGFIPQEIDPDGVARRVSPFGRGDEEILWLGVESFLSYDRTVKGLVKLHTQILSQLNCDTHLNRIFDSSVVMGYWRNTQTV